MGKFMSTDTLAIDAIAEEERAVVMKDAAGDMSAKALGVVWNLSRDLLLYSCSGWKADEEGVTKRQMLKVVAGVYDPLGLVLPVVITGRLLFQAAVRLRLDWDVKVDIELREAWNTWLKDMVLLDSLLFPRCISAGGEGGGGRR